MWAKCDHIFIRFAKTFNCTPICNPVSRARADANFAGRLGSPITDRASARASASPTCAHEEAKREGVGSAFQ